MKLVRYFPLFLVVVIPFIRRESLLFSKEFGPSPVLRAAPSFLSRALAKPSITTTSSIIASVDESGPVSYFMSIAEIFFQGTLLWKSSLHYPPSVPTAEGFFRQPLHISGASLF